MGVQTRVFHNIPQPQPASTIQEGRDQLGVQIESRPFGATLRSFATRRQNPPSVFRRNGDDTSSAASGSGSEGPFPLDFFLSCTAVIGLVARSVICADQRTEKTGRWLTSAFRQETKQNRRCAWSIGGSQGGLSFGKINVWMGERGKGKGVRGSGVHERTGGGYAV